MENNAMRYFERGFTLVEILIVIVILGILIAITLPIYENYKIRSDFTEVTLAVHGVTRAITACSQRNADLRPCSDASDGSVKVAYDNLAALDNYSASSLQVVPSHASGKQAVIVSASVTVPTREDASGNTLVLEYTAEVRRDRTNGAIELIAPTAASSCATQNFC